jgi:hypothetical protein
MKCGEIELGKGCSDSEIRSLENAPESEIGLISD